jgi:hypothetical protein
MLASPALNNCITETVVLTESRMLASPALNNCITETIVVTEGRMLASPALNNPHLIIRGIN